jgi:lysophospholipase L1-like esterase
MPLRAVPAPRSLPVAPTDPALTPVIGNPTYRTPPLDVSAWLTLHAQYAARALLVRNPVVFLGDSIIYFWGDTGRVDQGSQWWNGLFAPVGAANFGISGDQTGNVLWRIQNGELAGRPRVVVLEVGINNLFTGQTPAETVAGITAVVRAIHAASPQTQVLLLGILPVGAGIDEPLRIEVTQVNASIAGLGRLTYVRYIDAGASLLGTGGVDLPGVRIDNYHPSSAGYAILSNVIAGALAQMLRR